MAARAYLRAGQLATAGDNHKGALDLYARAHRLVPDDRSVSLFYAQSKLRAGDAAGGPEVPQPLSPSGAPPPVFPNVGRPPIGPRGARPPPPPAGTPGAGEVGRIR